MNKKNITALIIISFFLMLGSSQAMAANARFDVNQMGDMSDFDPNNPIIPTGDTIKIAVVSAYSGPAGLIGQVYFAVVQSVAHDINKRGGIMVDGKKKLVQVIKANGMSDLAQTKKICEKMVLQDKVDVLWGTNGSHLMKVINQVAKKYKVIAQCATSMSDELYDATNFNRYSFMTNFSTQQVGRATAYYYGKIRKQEKKFYILCQDYLFGHSLAAGLKEGLKEYYPEAEIVGEDYHKLFLTDYAPYLEKIKASGAEVIYTGDMIPDAANLLKQARQMQLKIPFAHVFLSDPSTLHAVGVEGSKGLVHIEQFSSEPPAFKTAEQIKYYHAWNDQWKKWEKPFSTRILEHGTGSIGSWRMATYWLLSVIERAGSTDPEKIIKVWEGDSFEDVNGNAYKMRACDHKAIRDLFIEEYVPPEQQKVSFNIPPYYWFKDASETGPCFRIEAQKVLPKMDQNLDRCKGKDGWGN